MINDKQGVLSGKKAIGIILLVVGIMLTFFIVSQGLNVYNNSRQVTDDRGTINLQCVGYLFTISEVFSDGGEEIQFKYENSASSTENVNNITVAAIGEISQTFDIPIYIGDSLAVRVPISVIDNFTVYPDNCNVIKANCNVQGECAYK
jgi:hypothetical protein